MHFVRPVALVARFDDVAVMSEPIQQPRRPLRVADTLDHSAKSRLIVIIMLACSCIQLDIGDHVDPPFFFRRA